MMIKKLAVGAVIMLACVMAACNTQSVTKEDKVSVVCTVFAAYDWTRALLTDQAEAVDVEYLFDDGADVHSFQPGADDYVKIAESDIFIYIGGPGTEWIEDALNNSPKKERIVIDLSQAAGVELIENTADTQWHSDDEDESHSHEEHEHAGGFDEHIWMSVTNAESCVYEIADALCEKMPRIKKQINANCDAYVLKLEELDEKYRDEIESYYTKYIVVADRFPFRYLTQEYGISYDAAFAGCQTEAEADFDMIIRLANAVDESDVPAIVVTEVSDQKLAETILENTEDDYKMILVLDSMQAVTAGDVRDGVTYLGVMEQNLETLQKAFP